MRTVQNQCVLEKIAIGSGAHPNWLCREKLHVASMRAEKPFEKYRNIRHLAWNFQTKDSCNIQYLTKIYLQLTKFWNICCLQHPGLILRDNQCWTVLLTRFHLDENIIKWYHNQNWWKRMKWSLKCILGILKVHFCPIFYKMMAKTHIYGRTSETSSD